MSNTTTDTATQPLLASDDVGKALFKLSVPAIMGMMISALYNIVDAAFVGRGAGPLAIGGLTIVFPIQMLITSLAQIFGIGAASIISRRLGKSDTEGARIAADIRRNRKIISYIMHRNNSETSLLDEPLSKLIGF